MAESTIPSFEGTWTQVFGGAGGAGIPRWCWGDTSGCHGSRTYNLAFQLLSPWNAVLPTFVLVGTVAGQRQPVLHPTRRTVWVLSALIGCSQPCCEVSSSPWSSPILSKGSWKL